MQNVIRVKNLYKLYHLGEESNVSCSLYNLGRVKLYNVKAAFEGKGIRKEELFVGSVEPGASAAIDAMLEGEKETKGPEKVKMTLTYEDEAGNVEIHAYTFNPCYGTDSLLLFSLFAAVYADSQREKQKKEMKHLQNG